MLPFIKALEVELFVFWLHIHRHIRVYLT